MLYLFYLKWCTITHKAINIQRKYKTDFGSVYLLNCGLPEICSFLRLRIVGLYCSGDIDSYSVREAYTVLSRLRARKNMRLDPDGSRDGSRAIMAEVTIPIKERRLGQH